MIELILLYKWVFLLLVISSLCLSQIGVHLVARQQSLNALMLTQVSTFGVLLGMLFNDHLFHFDSLDFLFPLIIGLLLTVIVTFVVERLRGNFSETFFLIIFLLFMALSYWVCSYFPGLDSHHADSFFGDIVTIQGTELVLSIFGFFLGAIYLFTRRRSLLNQSFEIEVFGKQQSRVGTDSLWVVSLLIMVLGIFSLGLLYTLSFMLMAPVLLAYLSKSLRRYLITLSIFSALSAVFGFVISLHFTRMSTAPTIVICLFILSSLTVFMRFVKSKIN